MKKRQRLWNYFHQHRVASIVAGHIIVMTVLGLVWLGTAFAPTLFGALAQAPCASGSLTYVVRSGDTLGVIAASHGTTWQTLSSYNHLSNPNMIFVGEHVCVPQQGITQAPAKNVSLSGIHGAINPYPYGQCTWWASQRYFELHGFYVPWSTNADAWQWNARAQDFHWNISSQPSIGSIVTLQPNVQGASFLGHVAVVERVLGNGHVIASNLNWGPNYSLVTNVDFHVGPGVSFISA
ncbi:CHAP domain-containing protein [Dictyobacter arantiisoli]|nr:CHAP domain-containing protein [Dictyobacter arantiisoli]